MANSVFQDAVNRERGDSGVIGRLDDVADLHRGRRRGLAAEIRAASRPGHVESRSCLRASGTAAPAALRMIAT